jgi:hypothetical protein
MMSAWWASKSLDYPAINVKAYQVSLDPDHPLFCGSIGKIR